MAYPPELLDQIARELPIAWAGRQCIWEMPVLLTDRRWTWPALADYNDFVRLEERLMAADLMVREGDERTNHVRATFARPGESREALIERHFTTLGALARREKTVRELRDHRPALAAAAARRPEVVAEREALAELAGRMDAAYGDLALLSWGAERALLEQVGRRAGGIAAGLLEVTLAENRASQLQAWHDQETSRLAALAKAAGVDGFPTDRATRAWQRWSAWNDDRRAARWMAQQSGSESERHRLHELAVGCAREAERHPGPELAAAQAAARAAEAEVARLGEAGVSGIASLHRAQVRARRRLSQSMGNLVGGRMSRL
jgi:hypothetical protein